MNRLVTIDADRITPSILALLIADIEANEGDASVLRTRLAEDQGTASIEGWMDWARKMLLALR